LFCFFAGWLAFGFWFCLFVLQPFKNAKANPSSRTAQQQVIGQTQLRVIICQPMNDAFVVTDIPFSVR
jgi:hypothetical protein